MLSSLLLLSNAGASAFVAAPTLRPAAAPRAASPMAMAAAEGEVVPDLQRRTIMNLVLLGGAAVPVAWLGGGFIYFLVPPSSGGGVQARDALGNNVKGAEWAKKNPFPGRALVE